MEEREVRKAKRFLYTAFAVVCILLLMTGSFFFYLFHRPIAPELEAQKLEEMTESVTLVCLGKTCYEFDGGKNLSGLCTFDAWISCSRPEMQTHILSMKLGDEYELALYTGGYAKAYYGYSSDKYLDTAWYKIPDSAVRELTTYITENGTVRQPLLGAGSWFRTVDS